MSKESNHGSGLWFSLSDVPFNFSPTFFLLTRPQLLNPRFLGSNWHHPSPLSGPVFPSIPGEVFRLGARISPLFQNQWPGRLEQDLVSKSRRSCEYRETMREKSGNLYSQCASVDMGAFVIVVNAEKIAVSGKKRTQKLYRRHSGRPWGMKVETFAQLQQRIPESIIEHAVRGMLPKGRPGRQLFTHLKVYEGLDHPHQAQKPIELLIRDKEYKGRGKLS